MKTENLINLSDETLLARIQNKDNDALEALIKKYEQPLKNIIRNEIRNPQEHTDIYSETVFAIMRRLRRRADDIESAEKWMKRVARSKCDAFRVDAKKRGLIREAAHKHYTSVADHEADERMRQYYRRERCHEVWEVVREMDSIYVEVFELWEQDLTEAESAAALNIPQNTVKSRRNKIRKVVRERLGVSLTSKKRE